MAGVVDVICGIFLVVSTTTFGYVDAGSENECKNCNYIFITVHFVQKAIYC